MKRNKKLNKRKQLKLQVVNKIKLKLNEQRESAFHTFFHSNHMFLKEWPVDLHNLTSLYLSSSRLQQLEPTTFQNMIHLKRLDLVESSIQELDSSIFSGLKKLKKLHLSSNQITNVNGDLFKGLNNLTELGLRYNQISRIPESIFQDLVSLESLDLAFNKINFLDKNGLHQGSKIFQGLNKLVSLDFHDNEISIIPEGIFQSLVSLTHLTIGNNKLTFLDQNGNQQGPNVFLGLNQLEGLFLLNNQIIVIPNGLFQNLFSLRILNLESNLIQVLDPNGNSFKGLKNLVQLVLKDNPIGSIQQGMLQELLSLKYLNCDKVTYQIITF